MFPILLRINALFALAVKLNSYETYAFLVLVLELNIDSCTIAREM